MELCDLTLHEIKDLFARKEVLPSMVLEAVAGRIREVEKSLGAYLALDLDTAFTAARAADARFQAGKALGTLDGIPVAIKDNLCQAGKETTCASRILQGFVPPYTATAVQKLLDQGAVIIGRTNMDEFAMGSSTENSAVKPAKNPWDPRRVPGGSSGGSAVAVAAGEAIVALGSDTGGSIRQPAAFCGVTGLKPTYGLVSRYGLVAFASSFDQIGPIAKDAEDCALLLAAIAGFDPLDATSVRGEPVDYRQELDRELTGCKIGLPREYFGAGLDDEVRRIIMTAVEQLEELGARVVELSLKLTEYALPVYYLISSAEASSNLARYDGIRYGRAAADRAELAAYYTKTRTEGFGPEVKRRIMLGTYALSAGYYEAYYQKAQQVRTLICREFAEAFRAVDAIVTPTSPTLPFRLGERLADPLAMYLSDVCTVPVNIAGLPAISIPCGFVRGLPVGMQIIGRPFAEGTILNIAHQFQKVTAYHRARPNGAERGEQK
ncbi:MAG TPA: Asp-tRNA(Asn)/Glu-tRNA(Gln) amidotransferase subunit GatA [Capillibacterium sp.]